MVFCVELQGHGGVRSGRVKKPRFPEKKWRGGKVPLGEEYYHYPSVLAQDVWLHVFAIGRSRTPRGHEHSHRAENRFLLHYVRRGEFWHTIRGRTLRVRAGSLCLMDLREPVRYGNDCATPAQVWWVYFGGRDMPRLCTELDAETNPVFEVADTARFEDLFRSLLRLTIHPPPGYEARASGILTLMLAELFAARPVGGDLDVDLVKLPQRQALLSRPVRDSIRCVARFYGEILQLKALSGVAGLSLYHFVRVFRRETGMTPVQYLNRYRIEKAKRALATSDQPIEQIGRMVGIPNRFKFFHQFRKQTGVTPEKFRALAKRSQ